MDQRGAGTGEAVARWWICADLRVVGVADPILSAHRPLFPMGALAQQRSVEPPAGPRQHQYQQKRQAALFPRHGRHLP